MLPLIQVYLSDLVVERQGGTTWYAYLRNPPDQIRGCPMGRGETQGRAVNDLIDRIVRESHVNIGWVNG